MTKDERRIVAPNLLQLYVTLLLISSIAVDIATDNLWRMVNGLFKCELFLLLLLFATFQFLLYREQLSMCRVVLRLFVLVPR